MASTSKCEYCGSTITSEDQSCPNCGATNPLYVVDLPRRVTDPKTIAELQEFCAERGMPLLRMRFFIGEDFKEPRAFGIFKDGNEFVVYKNKADGTRAERYRGPDEAKAVGELYDKLIEECRNRGIHLDVGAHSPDGTPGNYRTVNTPPYRSSSSNSFWNNKTVRIVILVIVVIALLRMCGGGGTGSGSSSSYTSTGSYYSDYDDNNSSWWNSDDNTTSWWDDDDDNTSWWNNDDDDDWGTDWDTDWGNDWDDWDAGDTDWGDDW